ncbi:MAG: hypothetical protein EOO90_29110 [Pedobacter sp.]|nr:MAG: hypothetical protein EOO90_29110 [Pedobacter sp.]
MKHIIYILSLLFLLSCNDKPVKENTGTVNVPKTDSINIADGKRWIKGNIESFFNNDSLFLKGFASLCTKQYAEFKQDAISIEYDGMTEEELKTKWGRRYSKYAGIGEGFMIAGQDYGKVSVTECEFKNKTEMGNYLYDVVIVDTVFHSTFLRQVVLTKTRDAFLIDDVLEIKNQFKGEK